MSCCVRSSVSKFAVRFGCSSFPADSIASAPPGPWHDSGRPGRFACPPFPYRFDCCCVRIKIPQTFFWSLRFGPSLLKGGATTTSADFCRDCGQHPCCPCPGLFSRTSRQTSRSKTRLIPSVRAGFTPQRPSEYRASESNAPLPAPHRPCIRFLFVTSDFCRQLPSDMASRPCPCLRLPVPLTTARRGFTPP